MRYAFVACRSPDGVIQFYAVEDFEPHLADVKRRARQDNTPVVAVIRRKLDPSPPRVYDTMRSG